MKVKNIMFFGFAAAILSAGAASAANTAAYDMLTRTTGANDSKIVTSKQYVDASTNALKTDINNINFDANYQSLQSGNTYQVSKNGAWTAANGAVAVDTTYMSKTDNADGSVQVAVDSTKLADTAAKIDANDAKLTTGAGVKAYVDREISAIDFDGDYQSLQSENSYQVSKNGAWTAANGAVAVDTTYMSKTDNADGSVQVAVDSTKLADTAAKIDANDAKLTTGAGVKAYVEGKGYITSADLPDETDFADDFQSLQSEDTYQVSKNGAWTAANGAVAVDTTYMSKTDNADGSVQVAVDSTKLADTAAKVGAGDTKLTTGAGVKAYVDGAITDGSIQTVGTGTGANTISVDGTDVLVQGYPVDSDSTCDSTHPCALVDFNGSKKWVEMAI